MKHRILNFLIALFIVSILIFLFFEKIAMPIYIRKGNSIRLINVRDKILDRGINELKISGFNDSNYRNKAPELSANKNSILKEFNIENT